MPAAVRAVVDLLRQRLGEWHERIDERLVPRLRLSELSHRRAGALHGGTERRGGDFVVVTHLFADRAQNQTPDDTGGAASGVGPCVAGTGEHRAHPRPGIRGSQRRLRGRPAASLHPDAVISVAGDPVHVAEPAGRGSSEVATALSARVTSGTCARDASLDSGTSRVLLDARRWRDGRSTTWWPSTVPRRYAGVSTGEVHSRSSSSSSQKRVSEHPAMSKLVQNSPTSGWTTATPASSSRRWMVR